MAVTSIQLYMVYQKLFKTEKPTKTQVMDQGVIEPDFNSADFDSNEYLSLEEGMNSFTISELLYETAVSAYGSAIINSDPKKTKEDDTKGPNVVIDLSGKYSGNNPFA